MLDHVGFPVSDFERSKRFYEEALSPLGGRRSALFWKEITMADRTLPDIAGVRIPDSRAAKEAEQLCREESSPMLYAHALRSYFFACLLGCVSTRSSCTSAASCTTSG
jgi:hypothetical protein